MRRRTPGRHSSWTQLWTQTRREPKGYEGTKARPRPRNPRRGVIDRDWAILGGTRPEVFKTAPFKPPNTFPQRPITTCLMTYAEVQHGHDSFINSERIAPKSLSVRDHDLPEMRAALKMPISPKSDWHRQKHWGNLTSGLRPCARSFYRRHSGVRGWWDHRLDLGLVASLGKTPIGIL